MKKYLITLIALLIALTGCKKYVVKNSYTTYQGNNQRTGVYNTEPVINEPSIKWQFNTEAIPIKHRDWAPQSLNRGIEANPAISDGVVYFGANDSYFRAVDAKTGKLKWKFLTAFKNRMFDGIISSPLIYKNTVYFSGASKYFYALDKNTGKEKWKYKTDLTCSTPILEDGIIYFNSKYLYAINAKTGKLKWKTKWDYPAFREGGDYEYSNTNIPAIAYGLIYAGDNFTKMYAFEIKTGKKVWTYDTKQDESFQDLTSPVIYKKLVYFGGGQGGLYAVDALKGSLKWKVTHTGVTHEIRKPPAIDNDTVYYADLKLTAYNAKSGKKKWKSKYSHEYTAPSIAGNYIYFHPFTSMENKLFALNKETGKKVWEIELKNGVLFTSPVVHNGVIYIGTEVGVLYALE